MCVCVLQTTVQVQLPYLATHAQVFVTIGDTGNLVSSLLYVPLVYNNFNCLRAIINVLFCTLVGEKSSAASETTELCRRLEKKICNLNSLGSKLKMENQGQLLLHVLLQVKYCGYETLTCCCVAQEWLQ